MAPPLVANERKKGRAWPGCDARELVDDQGRYLSAPKYPWCGRPGKWVRGDQHLCDAHAFILTVERKLSGVSPNGKWGGCLVHIDCVHSIDDPDWEAVYRKGRVS